MQDAWSSSQHRGLSLVLNQTVLKTIESYDLLASVGSPQEPVSDTADIELILDVLFIFMSGIAIIVGLIILVYAVVVLFDRYCGCGMCLGHEDEIFDDNYHQNGALEGPSAEAYGPVAYKARLWGLTSQERRAVLKQVFKGRSTQYSTKTRMASPSSPFHPRRPRVSVDLEGGRANPHVSSKSSVISECTSSTCIEARMRRQRDSLSSTNHERTIAKAQAEDDESESSIDSMLLDERRLAATTCAICLGEYEDGDQVLHGIHCSHLFHYDCILPWMEQRHDHCPYCRVEMMTPQDMRRAAKHVLGKQRLEELSWGKQRLRGDAAAAAAAGAAPDMTTSPLSNVSDTMEHRRGNTGTSRASAPDELISPNNANEISSPAVSDEAQVGLIIMTPIRDVIRSSSPHDVSPLDDSHEERSRITENPDNVREELETRLAASLEETSSTSSIPCTANSADA